MLTQPCGAGGLETQETEQAGDAVASAADDLAPRHGEPPAPFFEPQASLAEDGQMNVRDGLVLHSAATANVRTLCPQEADAARVQLAGVQLLGKVQILEEEFVAAG